MDREPGGLMVQFSEKMILVQGVPLYQGVLQFLKRVERKPGRFNGLPSLRMIGHKSSIMVLPTVIWAD